MPKSLAFFIAGLVIAGVVFWWMSSIGLGPSDSDRSSNISSPVTHYVEGEAIAVVKTWLSGRATPPEAPGVLSLRDCLSWHEKEVLGEFSAKLFAEGVWEVVKMVPSGKYHRDRWAWRVFERTGAVDPVNPGPWC